MLFQYNGGAFEETVGFVQGEGERNMRSGGGIEGDGATGDYFPVVTDVGSIRVNQFPKSHQTVPPSEDDCRKQEFIVVGVNWDG